MAKYSSLQWCWWSHRGLYHRTSCQCGKMDGTHDIVWATLLVALGSMLHGQTARKHDIDKSGIWRDIGDSSEGRELQWVTSEGGAQLDQPLRSYVFEGCMWCNNKGNLRELSCEKKSFRMRESVLKGADIDICKERETLDVICCVICHLYHEKCQNIT